MDIPEAFKEGLRVARASERLTALGDPIRTALFSCDRLLEIAPELQPEVDEITKRLDELVSHVEAASLVLLAKLDLAGA